MDLNEKIMTSLYSEMEVATIVSDPSWLNPIPYPLMLISNELIDKENFDDPDFSAVMEGPPKLGGAVAEEIVKEAEKADAISELAEVNLNVVITSCTRRILLM
jgi:hypothetical protein